MPLVIAAQTRRSGRTMDCDQVAKYISSSSMCHERYKAPNLAGVWWCSHAASSRVSRERVSAAVILR